MGYLITIDTALNLTKDFEDNRKKVIFTHGAFDLFHAGHSLFLNKSKKKGDILIVGLEPDSNIKKYKNPLRPIIPFIHRVDILLNHQAVDFVFNIDELERCHDEYYLNLYKAINPDMVTFGKNFTVKNRKKQKVAGVKLKEINAEVSSTTKIITSILNKYQDHIN